jgi:hypothetical protein
MPKICRVWTEPELYYLTKNYKLWGADECAKTLGRSINSVRIQAFYLGLTKPHPRMPITARASAAKRNGSVTEAAPVALPLATPAPSAVIESSFIRPPSLKQLMAGKA